MSIWKDIKEIIDKYDELAIHYNALVKWYKEFKNENIKLRKKNDLLRKENAEQKLLIEILKNRINELECEVKVWEGRLKQTSKLEHLIYKMWKSKQ